MHPETAETMALTALAYLAGEPETLLRFLNVSGLEVDDLRTRAGDPELLAAVLDFLLGDDALLTGFAADRGIEAKLVHSARRALPGAGED